MGGRQYVKGVDSYCCGRASCAMQRELWAAMNSPVSYFPSSVQNIQIRPVRTQASPAVFQESSPSVAVSADVTRPPTILASSLSVPSEVMTAFVPMSHEAVSEMLKIAKPGKNSIVVDPGCGDARILIEAAIKYDARGIGVEINSKTCVEAINNIDDAGLSDRISVTRGDCRSFSFANADVVALYLYVPLIEEISGKLQQIKPGGRVISYMHPLPFGTQEKFVVGDHVFYMWVRN